MPPPGVAAAHSLTYLSLGAGVQSSALYILCAQGKAPRADVAIFADVQDEPAYVYRQLDALEQWGKANGGCRIDRVTQGCISADIIAWHKGERPRFSPIPAFAGHPGGSPSMLNRHCTSDYKIQPIERHVRALMGYVKGQRIAGKATATALIGISRDEVQRMKPSRTPWIENAYPLVDLELRRADCVRVVESAGLPRPMKSSCVFCPFHDNAYWGWLKDQHPSDFERAAEIDDQVRDMSRSGIRAPVFLHRSLMPLRLIDFSDKQIDLFDGFQNECTGVCGV
jgi:hypothetical protein